MTQYCVEWNDTISYVYTSVCSFLELVAHSNAIFDLAWLPGGTKLVGFTFITKLLNLLPNALA